MTQTDPTTTVKTKGITAKAKTASEGATTLTTTKAAVARIAASSEKEMYRYG